MVIINNSSHFIYTTIENAFFIQIYICFLIPLRHPIKFTYISFHFYNIDKHFSILFQYSFYFLGNRFSKILISFLIGKRIYQLQKISFKNLEFILKNFKLN